MLSKSRPFLLTFCNPNNILKHSSCRHFHDFNLYDGDKDPAPYFFSTPVQKVLRFLTRPEYSKVFRKRLEPGQKALEAPVYKFMTNEELEEEIKKIEKKVDHLLQMPPAVKIQQPITEVIVKDSAITGHDTSKLIFTDISLGTKNVERFITIRDTDGTLYHADNDIRKRINLIYFPLQGRQMKEPEMFTDMKLFNDVLERKEYEFVLDRACVQYDPDEPTYQKITSSTYKHCDFNKCYDILRSTRHFGPMTFFLVWNNMMDNLLLELISSKAITEAVALVHLQRLLNPNMVKSDDSASIVDKVLQMKKSATDEKLEEALTKECILCIENYINNNSIKKGPLQLTLQSFVEMFESNTKVKEGIRLAHGGN